MTNGEFDKGRHISMPSIHSLAFCPTNELYPVEAINGGNSDPSKTIWGNSEPSETIGEALNQGK